MRWVAHVARTGEKRYLYRNWWENMKESVHFVDPGVDGSVIFN
jgi:hypothetical protein